MTAREIVRDLADRVWGARRDLYKVGIRLNDEQVKIVVDDYYWAALLTWGKRLDLPVEITVGPDGTGVRLWGIPVEVDRSLTHGEARFRAESIIP